MDRSIDKDRPGRNHILKLWNERQTLEAARVNSAPKGYVREARARMRAVREGMTIQPGNLCRKIERRDRV